MSRPIERRNSAIHGNGVFATDDIPAGVKIIRYKGTLRTHKQADKMYGGGSETGHTFLFTLNDSYVLDANVDGNKARWINHSCDPNCQAVLVEDEGNPAGDKVIIESLRPIKAGEELTYNYGIVLDECFELGLPCVTSDLGALAERSGAAGLRTRAGDEAGLAATLQRFVDEPGLWGELRGHVQPTQFGLDAHVTALQQIYDRALSSPAPAPFAAPVPALRRVLYMLDQRESAMVKLVVDGGPK